MKVNILISKINDIKEFVNIMMSLKYETIARSGRYAVDAKSIMGVFSLNLINPIELEIVNCDDIEVLNLIDKFIIKRE